MIKIKTADFNSFICFDLETTGLHRDAKIIEIGAVKIKDGYLVSRFSTLVDPQIVVDPLVTQITGITNEMLEGKPSIDQLIPSFFNFTEGLPLVAHNAGFDRRYIERDAESLGYHFDQPIFDTLQFARKVLPGLKSYKLTALTALLGIPHSEAHRAASDAEATARLYFYLKNRRGNE